MTEDKKEFLHEFANLLKMTSAAGHPLGNPLDDIEYVKFPNGDEIARPIFVDGAGKNGEYDVNISGDSCIAVLYDVVNHFCRRKW